MSTLETLFAQSVSREALAQKAARKRRVWSRFRLLPAVILSAGLLLGVKVTNIAIAADAALDAAALDANEQKTSPATAQKLASVTPGAGEKAGDKKVSAATPAVPAPMASPAPAKPETNADSDYMSRSEINLLQDLSSRRQQLEARAGELDTRDRLLMATEQRIDKKIERLKKIEAEIKDLLRMHDEQQEAQIQTLVRVYESMKPKDAAVILEKLDMDILVSVVEKMKDKKVALILAAMKPEAAKLLTVELATRKKLPEITG